MKPASIVEEEKLKPRAPRQPLMGGTQSGEYISRKRLIATIGLSNAARLVAAHGCLRFRVPHRDDKAFVELGRLIGYSAASILGATFSGQRIMLPVRAEPKAVKLRDRIFRESQLGKSADEIAAKLRVHTRYVYRLLAEAKKNQAPAQLSFK